LIKVPATTAGTVVVTVSEKTETSPGVFTSATRQVFTVIVTAATSVVYGTTKITTAVGGAGVWEDANGEFYIAKADTNAASDAVTVTATQYGSNGLGLDATAAKKVEFSLAGVGSLSSTNYLQYATQAAGLSNVFATTVYADGRGGTGTLTVTVDGKVIGTKKFYFFGQAASAKVTTNRSIAKAGTTTFGDCWATAVPAFELLVKDANGITIPDVTFTPTLTSSNGLAIDGGFMAQYVCQDNGTNTDSWAHAFALTGATLATSGSKSTLTWTLINADATVVTATADATVGGSASTVALTLDKATYTQGEKATLTITGKDSSGNPVYDGASLTGVLSSNVASQGLPTAAGTTATGGKKTVTVYAPTAAGSWTISGLNPLSAAVSVSATVASAADLAAAQAAITTLQTSVAALQTTVASLVASLTAQIKVINSALAKIAKKLKVKI